MKVTHIIGLQGCGKSTLAALMVNPLAERGAVCAVVDSDSMASTYKGDPGKAVAAHAHVDYLFLEYLPQTFRRAKPGDKVIHVTIWPELAQSPTSPAQAAAGNAVQGV